MNGNQHKDAKQEREMFINMLSRPFRHLASDVLNDLITAILVALAAVIASGLLARIWDRL